MGNGPLAARLAKQRTAHTKTGVFGRSYGYGLFVDDGLSPVLVHHGGGSPGFLGTLEIVPEAQVAAMVLVNADWDFPGALLVEAITKLVDLKAAGNPPTIDYASFAGSYQSLVFGKINVTAKGQNLTADFADHGYSTPLVVSFGNSFTVDWNPNGKIPILFWHEPSQPPSYLVSPYGIAKRL
jgi:hypothetical protein